MTPDGPLVVPPGRLVLIVEGRTAEETFRIAADYLSTADKGGHEAP